MMQPEFLYFDLGKVLLHFDIEQMFRQMGAASGVDPQRVQQAVFQDGLQAEYETGRVSSRQFYETFCRRTGARPDYHKLLLAANDIFELKVDVLPVVTQLSAAGYQMGILSNTCESHWQYCAKRFSILRETFAVHALSYRIGAAKPQPAIYRAAAELAGVEPPKIFFVDDIPEHVAGAKAAGFDAVAYTSTPQLVAELRQREVRFNY